MDTGNSEHDSSSSLNDAVVRCTDSIGGSKSEEVQVDAVVVAVAVAVVVVGVVADENCCGCGCERSY